MLASCYVCNCCVFASCLLNKHFLLDGLCLSTILTSWVVIAFDKAPESKFHALNKKDEFREVATTCETEIGPSITVGNIKGMVPNSRP
ncbi:hypothetical protein CICLE_v10013779mg [Citrus x clementina]|uniref:Uncharacterized protein n=1 Tax=Citrus clementina TaxID=85681 RepID=V4UR18_CITCL|nr:hypothetical protein CICLE_v10013779mg [Citrus x clementina]